MKWREKMKKFGSIAVVGLMMVLLAGCYPTVKSGQRCSAGSPRGSDGRYVLDCVKGKYKRVMTLAEANRRAALVAPARIQVSQGNNQVATVGGAYADLVVQVFNGNGSVSTNAVVEFIAPPGGPSLSIGTAQLARTGADGRARIAAVAGTAAGSFGVLARVVGTGIATSFSLASTPSSAARVVIESGAGQSAAATTQFGAQIVGVVVDAYGNPVGGQTVTFASPNDRVWFGPATVTGGADGRVRVTSGAGQIAGTENATVTLGSSVTTFALTVAAGAPVNAQVNSGNAQGAVVGNPFFNANLTIGVIDSFGNPVPGVAVTYVAQPGPGGASITVPSATVLTNADGIAALGIVANSIVGNHNVTASVIGQTFNFSLENFAA